MHYLVMAGFIIAWLILFIPTLVYLGTTWKVRFDNLKSRFNDEAIRLYLTQYFPSETVPSGTSPTEFFERKVNASYGRYHYVPPLVLLIVISGIALTLIALSVFKWLGIDPSAPSIPPVAASALLGAYVWSAYDQIQRYRTRDFTSHDVYKSSFRFIIAVPLGYSVAALLKDEAGVTIAFFLGAFPVKTLTTLGKRLVTTKLGVGDQGVETKSELEQLQGINRLEAERFQEEGITNVLQLAYADPVDLTFRTNYEFNYVIDCMSQALLWLYLDKNIASDKLRVLGLRGAYEARVLNEMLCSEKAEDRKKAEDNLAEIAKVLNVSERAFYKSLFEIAEDPYTKFLYNIWA